MIEFLLVAKVVGGIGILLYFWEYLVHFFSKNVIPWIKKYWSVSAADLVAKLISFLDGKIVPTKALLKKAWTYFKTNILKMNTEYVKVDANTAERKTTTWLKDSQGDAIKTIVEEKVSWSELPQEIREQMINEDTNEGMINEKQQIINKMSERCEEECIEIMV